MGDGGQPADKTGSDTAKKPADPLEAKPTATSTDNTSTPLESGKTGDSALSPIAQIAVDNQAGKLPGAPVPDKDAVDGQGNLNIKPIAGQEKGDGAKDKPDVPVANPDPTADLKPRSVELAQTPPSSVYRDGYSDAIELTTRRVAQLPADDKARQLVIRDLAEQFQHPKTYAEKLQAAKALIALTKGPDGKIPDTVAMRDVAISEKGKWSGGRQSKWVVEVKAHHELQPLSGAEVFNFIKNSGESLEQQVKALKDRPADDKDRHNLQQQLTGIFQTYPNDTPEKLAAAKGLLELNRKADGTYPDALGVRTVEVARQEIPGTRREAKKVIEAHTDTFTTTKAQVDAYLAPRSEGLIADTAKIVDFRERTKQAGVNGAEAPSQADKDANDLTKTALYNRSVHIFLDSTIPANKTAAAIALLELRTGTDGSIGDKLGLRDKHEDAVIKKGMRRGEKDVVVTPAKDYVQTITKDDAIKYLQTQLDPAVLPRERLMAADALKNAKAIDETRYKEVVRGIISDDRTADSLKVELRKTSGVEETQEQLKLASDGRVIGAKPEDYVNISNENGERERLQLTLDRLAKNPDLKKLVSDKQIEEMDRELQSGKFGPASRDFYNKSANYLNELTTNLAVTIVGRNGNLPEGSTLTVPKDGSGRAVGDDYFRAQILSGRVKMDLKTLKPGELPEGDRLADTALWDVSAVKEMDNLRLKWEVSVFDDQLQGFNKNGKLDAWMSNDKMSIDQLRELQSARGEWLQLGMQVRNYAHAIHYFNKATSEGAAIPRLSFSQAEMSKFSDEALNDANFPGKVVRENGKIKSIEIDLPETLDRSATDPNDPTKENSNLTKVAKLRAWLEKYGPQVDQLTDEIKKASIDSGRLLMWGDIEHEGIDEVTKKPYNFTALRLDSERVMVKMPDGSQEERIRVTSSRQHKYAGGLSLYKTVGDITDVGDPVTSGETKVNGKVVPLSAGDAGVTLGSQGTIKIAGDSVDPNHASMRVDTDGRVFIKDNSSKNGTYVGGEKIESGKWVEVFPDQNVSLGKPATTLALGRNEKGEATFNGQTLKVGEPTMVGTKSGIKAEGDGVSEQHAAVKVESDGRMFIKDNGSEQGTYVNGKKVSDKEWTQISEKDKVTFGPPPSGLDIEGDVRLYKPNDMVTVLIDGQMQLMPAENLKAWSNEAAAWHYTGKGAMALMDLGMIVTATYELKGIQFAATQGLKEAGKLGAKTVFSEMVRSPGFARAAWHAGLGVTGILHQSIENTGPLGKKFNELRGYAMMADIFYGSVIKDGVSLSRKAFGMAKPAEQASAAAEYIKMTPWAKVTSNVTEKMFLGMNGYFVGDILAHQMPAIATSVRKLDTGALLNAGMLLRAGQYDNGSDKGIPPLPTLEDQARRFTSDTGREKISLVEKEAAEAAKLPKEQKKERQEYLAKLTSQFLDSPNQEDKLAAAFGLLTFHAQDSKTIPDVLGTRWKTQNDLPDNVTSANVKAFIDSKIPRSIDLFDKQLQTGIESRFADVAKVSNTPADSAERKQLNDKLLREFTTGKTENERVSAAMGLMLLNEHDGKVPDKLGTVDGANGRKREVTKHDIQTVLDTYKSKVLLARYDGYVASMQGNESLNTVLGKTRDLISKSNNAEARTAESARLQAVFENSTNKEEKAAAALGLIFLNADKQTGAFPERLAYTKDSITVQDDEGFEFEIDTSRELKSKDVIGYLKGNMPSFSPETQLAIGDLLYRADEAPMAGRSKFNDYAGLLLSVVQNNNASPEARKQALVNPNGLGMAEAMAIHRFNTEQNLPTMDKTLAARTEADIYGRDSKAMEKALLDIIAQPNGDKDLKALASTTLLANSEPDPVKRKAMLTQMQTEYAQSKGKPGAYYDLVFQRESNTVKTVLKNGEPDNEEDVSRLYRAAVIMSQNNNWKDFGVTDQQMALSFEAALTGGNAVLASHALEPMLKHYDALTPDAKQWAEHSLLGYIKDAQGLPGTSGNLLRLDVINHLEQLNAKLGPSFAAKARKNINEVLTPDSVQNKTSDPETRAALVRALGKTSSNDIATQDLLKRIVGGGTERGDSSALVRSAAVDRLAELKPAGINQWAAKLLETEKDPEVLRKLGVIEQSSRRMDPDSSEYRERFRQSFNKLMESAAGKYTLADVPSFIRQNYPMLEWTTQFKDSAAKAQAGLGNWKWAWQKTPELVKPYMDAGKAATSAQLDQVIAKAARPEGDMERRTLAWIVMSNGRFFDEATKSEAMQRAAQGLLNASLGDATTKAQVAPLLTMAIATQDRMPHATRDTLVTALENLKPGTPGSPVTKEDAGTALLAGLKRQFERTPRDGSDPNYKASHALQMHLLDAYSKYATAESIPVLEAIAANQTKVEIVRDKADRLKDTTYPDKSSRSVDYDQNDEVWKVSSVTNSGVKQTLIRQGKSDEWYEESDPSKKTVWRGKVTVDQASASILMADSFGKSITYTADGSSIQRTGTAVTKVTYPDGGTREVTSSQDIITDKNGLKEIWTRQPNTSTWTSDTDPAKKGAYNGTRSFDSQGNVVLAQGADKQVIRPDSSSIFYTGEKATYSTPSTSDYSAHSMPLVRERAKQLLGDLRDGTDILLRNLPLDTQSTPQQLADNLRKLSQDPNNNSEAVARAVLVAGLSKPLTGAEDPRRAVLQDMLNDPHERIRMSAARVLFQSGSGDTQGGVDAEKRKLVASEDRAMAAKVIADIAKNGSKQGFRDDANRLIAEVKQQAATPGSTNQNDAQLLETALQNTKSSPRIDNGRFEAPHTIDQQEKYEQATGALIRDNLLPLDGLENPEWWTQHGYKLLEAKNYITEGFETSDSVKFNIWEKIKARFTDTDVKAKFQAAFDAFNKNRDDQIKLLTDRAMANDDTEESRDARKALAFIVLSNGYPLTENIREATVSDAARVLSRIYTRGGPGAAYAEQIITDALVANPGINIGVRTRFAQAVIERQGLDASIKGNASAPKAALLLANALDAETWAMPLPNQPGYEKSIDFQSMIMMRLDRLGEPIAMPVLEAMAKGHPNADLKQRAGEMFNRFNDGTSYLYEHTVPDTTSNKADQAKAIADLLARKENPKDDTELARELVRLAHPSTFSKEAGASDPRVEVLRTALNHSNERIRMIAADSLTSAGDPRGVIASSQLQDSSRPGIKREAALSYEGTFMMRFALAKLTPDGETFARQTMKDSSSDRARIAAARLILAEHPTDAAATEVMVKSYAVGARDVANQGQGTIRNEAQEAIKEMIAKQPIEKSDDPRRAVLENQLSSGSQDSQLAAAWLLLHSSVPGDFEKSVATLGRLAVNTSTKGQAQTLLMDVIAKGSDKQQEYALKQWNDSWVAKGSPADDRPHTPSDLEQARKFFRSADAAERARIFALPEAEKKALIMQLGNKSEQEVEYALQPAPSADFVPRQSFANPFSNPFGALSGRQEDMFRPENLFRTAVSSDWTGSGFSNRPLATRWQPGDNGRTSQRIPTLGNTGLGNLDGGPAQPYYRATTRGVPSLSGPGGIRPLGTQSALDGKTPYIRVDGDNATAFLNLDADRTGKPTARDSAALARLSFANMLQEQSRTGSVVQIGRDGKFSLAEDNGAPDAPTSQTGARVRFALPGADGRKPLTLDGSNPTPPEFSDFLEFLSKNRPDVMQQQTIKSSELSVMFLQYLRQREAGLQSGFVVTPSLFDRNVEALTSDSNVVQWHLQSTNRGSSNQNRWSDVQRERERMRAGKLDEQLTKLLAAEETPSSTGTHWQPAGKVEIKKPDLLSNPPVENLEINRLGLTDILPAELVAGRRQSFARINFGSTPGDTTSFAPPDVSIPTAMLNADLWRAKQSIDADKIVISRTPGLQATRRSTYELSPESQEILRRFRRVRLENQIDSLNNWPVR